jgi:hypothetical protein
MMTLSCAVEDQGRGRRAIRHCGAGLLVAALADGIIESTAATP